MVENIQEIDNSTKNCGNSIMYEIAQSSNCCQKATVKSYP